MTQPKKNPDVSASEQAGTDAGGKRLLMAVTAAFGMAGVACATVPLVRSLMPPKDVATTETLDIKLAEVPEGGFKTYLWRGRPVFVVHRSAAQIAEAREWDHKATMDPQADAARVQRPEWLVVMGVCTHLGCVPMQGGVGDGWVCPCHGSAFDLSGRVIQGPAERNLEIPPYRFLDDATIRVG